MIKMKNNLIIIFASLFVIMTSCHDLDDLNINPNGVDPELADLNLLLPTIITGIGNNVLRLGVGDIGGVMQHTQKDGWSSGHNDYDWDNQNKSWKGYYDILRNNNAMYKKAVDEGHKFHEGVALILKSYTFGMIADLWGDAPYSQALQGEDGSDFFKPVYDDQKDIYLGILADLETANTILSNNQNTYTNIQPVQDVLFEGNVMKWRKFGNALAMRYYMRLSLKEPAIAEAGIRKIASDPSNYPLLTDASDDATIGFVGNSTADSWPTNTKFDPNPQGTYFRTKLCATLVNALQELNDPRLSVWANPIAIPLELVTGTGVDEVIEGKRQISQDIVDTYESTWNLGIDFDPLYVGIPPSVFAAPQYNLNPFLEQAVFNPHASQLNEMYKSASGPLLLMRLMSAAEVHFVLSEAALYGWGPGTPEGHYAAGIQQSFNAWGVGGMFGDYIGGAPYSGIESIIQQKWIASWTSTAESWADYKRTGLPDFQTGESAKRAALPLRFYYHFDHEIALNPVNSNAAIDKLQATGFIGNDGSNNSAWSKTWLLQGTGKPY